MGCCQTKPSSKGLGGAKYKLEGVDDEAPETEVAQTVKVGAVKLSPETLLLSASLGGDFSTVQNLLSQGVSVNTKGEKDYTPLHNATRNGHTVPFMSFISFQLLSRII
jgi:ankyrin repeat protein